MMMDDAYKMNKELFVLFRKNKQEGLNEKLKKIKYKFT